MSNAAIGCLSFGARSERHRRPTAAEHSFGSRSGRVFLNSWLPDANAYAYRMLSEGPQNE